MDRRGVFSVSIVCLLITLAVASDPATELSEGKREAETQRRLSKPLFLPAHASDPLALAGSSGRVSSLRASEAGDPETRNASVPGSLVLEDAVVPDSPGERTDNLRLEQQVEQQVEEQKEEYEGEDEDEDDGKSDGASDGKSEEAEDEYEDELKAVAESHEAMLRDDTRNSNASTATSTAATTGLLNRTSAGSRNFHSREVITNSSDEDVASNEAITDEFVDKYDREVAELLKYKKQRAQTYDEGGDLRTKTKRVPTVKKELSTQKEILIGSNETQVPKSLLPPEVPANRLNEETQAIRRKNAGSNGPTKAEDRSYPERSEGEEEILASGGYPEPGTKLPKKLDKRQETVLKNLQSYLLTEYANEEKQRQKLHELWARENALVEKLLQLLAKVAENPGRWDREQVLQGDSEDDPKRALNELDPAKRRYESTPSLFASVTTNDSRKPRKKLKKKKSGHRFSTTTLMSVPATPSLLTTTETPWQTTPVQWRLVAERLFNPPTWQHDLQAEETANPRFSAQQSARSELIEQNKSRSNTYLPDRKPILGDQVGELGNQRLMRFGKLAARQPGHLQPREFAGVYDRPTDLERVPDYDIPESYHRSRYGQLPPTTREYLRRLEEEDQGDLGAFRRDQEHQSQARDFPLSKSWPDLSYGYDPSWRTEERPLLPRRQPTSDPKHWPQRASFLPVNKSYWSAVENEEEAEQEAEAEKMWQQRVQSSWNRDRPSWPVEKPLKVPLPWQQQERPAKQYDREQNGGWEKSKNRSESSRSSLKDDVKEKVVLPQITMKTWNSLTSDPATWPHKLPGAKPWPKDENGKSYNPNADLVKKLGLDQQKEEVEKAKDEKQNRLFSSKEFGKEEKLARTDGPKYKSNEDRSNFSDYKARSGESMKSWAMLSDPKDSKEWARSEDMQGDDAGAWRRKYEEKSSWPGEAALPKIQSVGAWVMAADQSTWKPYQMKPMEPSDESGSRRWSKPLGRSNTDAKWASKGSWPEKANDSWMDQTNVPPWPEKSNVLELWPEKAGKPSFWFAKTKDEDGWTSKQANSDSWKTKGDWLTKPESNSWLSKIADKSWATRVGSWSTKSNESWTSKANDEVSKLNGDPWSAKMKEDDSGDAWARKSNEQNGWKGNELSPWQQKMNDEWGYGKTSSTGTWPTKWKQFAYHRVTAMPISKPGTTADAASSKSKNAFVAVSAVSSPKYTGSDWRKSEDDARSENGRGDEQERSNQLQVGLERPIYAWKKDPVLRGSSTKGNSSDPLENQLEALRQIDFWSYKENEAEKRLASTSATTETTSPAPANNSTTATNQRRGAMMTGSGSGLIETNRRTISMK